MRIAIVDKEKCNPSKCGKECQKYCPIQRSGKDIIKINDKATINESLCIGCGICVKKCPFKAIKIINLPELKGKIVHRFLPNGFVLLNFPIPKSNAVIGILGRNGTGKSTSLKILANVIKPNFGKEEITEKEIIKNFKGSEAQDYFKKLYQGKIKISYKEQYVDNLIDKFGNLKVKEYLKECNEELIKKLKIEKILNRKISNLSGGELQRVAIAYCLSKNADLYLIDEPSSYLDIKNRLNVAKIIRENKKTTFVVEHDLIVLDIISDIIYIFYGSPSFYGIVSIPYSTKNGINNYLTGYLKEENVRFRDKPIIFEKKSEEREKGKEKIISWSNMKVRLGNFELQINEGEINKNEVTCIIGENGIGKTTFAKVLAGLIKPIKGEINKKVTISYKKQYLEGKSEIKVKNLFSNVDDYFNTKVIAPLEINLLYNKKLNELSGGELQRVAIAYCLSKNADLYLIDEPSSYLDVEQRLNVAKVIKSFMLEKEKAAIVIDHDLLFVDYLADSIIVFKGIPSVKGELLGKFGVKEGFNLFLKDLGITFRRDEITYRPRSNKQGSQIDKMQKETGEYFHI